MLSVKYHPPSLVGKYDVVHFRTWGAIVKENNPSKLIHHAMSLLSMKSFYFLSLMDWLINCAYSQSLEDIFNGKRYIPGRRSFRVVIYFLLTREAYIEELRYIYKIILRE
jgi:hypothetical protein